MREPADILVAGAGPAGLPLPDSAFPHLSLVRQMDVEQVLAAALAERAAWLALIGAGSGIAGEWASPGPR
jgi:hypothetical protein